MSIKYVWSRQLGQAKEDSHSDGKETIQRHERKRKKEKERERLVRKTVKKICIVFLVLTQISFVTMAIPLVSLGLHLPTSKCR